MKKHEGIEEGGEKARVPFSSEYYHGMSDTVIEGTNEYRIKIGTLLQALQPLLRARSVSVEVLQAKEMLEGLREDVEYLEEIQNPERHEEKESEIKTALAGIERFIEEYADIGQTPRGRKMSGLHDLPDDPDAPTIVAPDWTTEGRLQ